MPPSSKNTGPKSVLHDFQLHKAHEQADRILKAQNDWSLAYKQSMALTLPPSTVKSFGSLEQITAETFSDEIDAELQSGALVLILIQEQLEGYSTGNSRAIRNLFEELAEWYPNVKMRCLNSSLEAPYLDPVALPAILVYQNGDLKQSIMRFTDDLCLSCTDYRLKEDQRCDDDDIVQLVNYLRQSHRINLSNNNNNEL